MTRQEAVLAVGLPESFDVRKRPEWHVAMSRWKDLTVEARQSGDDEECARLSQAHEVLKRLGRLICACGLRKHPNAMTCPRCKSLRPVRVKLGDGCLQERVGTLAEVRRPAMVKYSNICECRRIKTRSARWCPECRKRNGYRPPGRGGRI